MADVASLYETDLLLWAEQQADALARLRGRVRGNDIDWEHLIEEVRDLGLSELRATSSHLTIAALHLLKLAKWPDHPATVHWLGEVEQFLESARGSFWPSMRPRLDAKRIGRRALAAVNRTTLKGHATHPLPAVFVPDLDAMLSDDFDIEAAVTAIRAQATGEHT